MFSYRQPTAPVVDKTDPLMVTMHVSYQGAHRNKCPMTPGPDQYVENLPGNCHLLLGEAPADGAAIEKCFRGPCTVCACS